MGWDCSIKVYDLRKVFERYKRQTSTSENPTTIEIVTKVNSYSTEVGRFSKLRKESVYCYKREKTEKIRY